MDDKPRLIEHAFPLKQASLDSVHEKNVRHGHISTLHIWPARRPLAACRAALIATLLPDPGTPEERQKLCEKIGGKVVKKVEKKRMPNGRVVERVKEETEGGILHWKRETENAEDLAWFRKKIRDAYGGRAPKVFDPFAGGGAIPLEAMRLGCKATAVDINPVSWFILKCTLEYPQKLAGKIHPLPDFILEDDEFMETFYKANPHLRDRTKKTKKQIAKEKDTPGLFDKPDSGRVPKADLAWHVRAWGRWVLAASRKELAQYYPTYAEFEPLDKKKAKPYENQPMQLVPLKDDGTPDTESLNVQFEQKYLDEKKNPRWVIKPAVAYLWARTVTCKNCRASIPLLKTRWLSKKQSKRVLLTASPNSDKSGIDFGVEMEVPVSGGNPAQRREHDKRMGQGTMSRSGAKCPCCPAIMTMDDIRTESTAGRCGYQLMCVVVQGVKTKEYRPPTIIEVEASQRAKDKAAENIASLPHLTVGDSFAPCSTRSISAQLYGVRRWSDLFTARQIAAISGIGRSINNISSAASEYGYSSGFSEAIGDYLCLGLDRLLCFSCVNVRWKPDADSLTDAFSRFSISLLWDFAEAYPLGTAAGSYLRCNDRIALALDGLLNGCGSALEPTVMRASATKLQSPHKYDLIITDPPYYQAVSYADLSDFFYTWLRGVRPLLPREFAERLTEKADEVVQHVREDKEREIEKAKYERQMSEAFSIMRELLESDGKFVCVFAHKDPDAWETLVSAMIRSGFVVNGSWPIQDNLPSRQRASATAALASSVWLVCRPRMEEAKPGWDNNVIGEMRRNIAERLREYWDAGIRGPDFVWAATGPALEAFSKHPIVKKANNPGQVMTVREFLSHVRRMVVDYVVGQVLSGNGEGADMAAADQLDEPTAYYLLHRNDFGIEEAPAGTCILYAVSCGLSDRDLESTWDLLVRTSGQATSNSDDDEESNSDAADDSDSGSGSMVKLKTWAQRIGRTMGYEAPGGKPVPLIDRIHRLMHLWKAGDVQKVDDYLDDNGLRRQELFKRLLQSLIELSPEGSAERSILESLSNHVQAKGAPKDIHYPMGLGDN